MHDNRGTTHLLIVLVLAAIWFAGSARAEGAASQLAASSSAGRAGSAGAAAMAPAVQPGGDAAASSTEGPAWAKLNVLRAQVMPVQYGGRIMPLDTLARELVREVTGKRTWDGQSPTATVLAWAWQPQAWRDEPMVLVRHPQLQEQLGMDPDRRRFSYAELTGNPRLVSMTAEAQHRRQANQPLTAEQRTALQVWERVRILDSAFQGQPLRIVPAGPADQTQTWLPVAEVEAQTGIGPEQQDHIRQQWQAMRSAFLEGRAGPFNKATVDLTGTFAAVGSPTWPAEKDLMALETIYNMARPFRIGWILTCAAMVVGLVATGWPNKWVKRLAWVLLLDGFAVLTLGIVLRWKFAGQPPLATMYESLVFMGWGAVAIGIVAMWVFKHRAAVAVVAGVATAILVVADAAPLQSTAGPLEPVLRNTAWLTIHVLTIMLGYSAFALAMGAGHVQAVALALRPGPREWTGQMGRLLYGLILAGAVFLTAGIIFGAIWASEAWSRYWGWDPKETWSLITLLGYMAVLHGRRAGWFGSFGMAVASIVCFQLVLMTYYGVNFVLGRGLHSYGFSQGGQLWVGLYVLLEVLFVLGVWGLHTQRSAGRGLQAEPDAVSASGDGREAVAEERQAPVGQ